jgi:hypothetical protein
MKKRKRVKREDPRLETPPGHFLKNAPWRADVVIGKPESSSMSAHDSIVLAFLLISTVAIATAFWMNPPHIIRFNERPVAVAAQATLAGNRLPRPYNGLGYDPQKFEEVKDDDPIIQDDLEDVLLEENVEHKPAQL